MKYVATVLGLLIGEVAFAQGGMWTWMKGSNTVNSTGNYGLLGVADPNNLPPSRYAPAQWTDTAGNLWIYGGLFQDGPLADLWKFNPNTLIWTWVNGSQGIGVPLNVAAGKGVFDAANTPGQLGWGILTWADSKNHLWLYGGYAEYQHISSNFWQYDPVINQWAWMGGFLDTITVVKPVYGIKGIESSSNNPGSRYETNTCWVDSNDNLWFFGGQDTSWSLAYADMWRYNTTTNLWAWMSGSNQLGSAGVYGPLGSSSPNYHPSSRVSNFRWKDESGNFWLIGGHNFAHLNYYQDVWYFNPVTLNWTLIQGSPQPDTISVVSGNCNEDSANREGGRYENRVVWKICDSIILNYNGTNFGTLAGSNSLNEVWAYLPSRNNWVLAATGTISGNYGTMGVAAATNFPPSRIGSAGFVDNNGNLWLFGGGNFSSGLFALDDVWKFRLDTVCIGHPDFCYRNNCQAFVVSVNGNPTIICSGDSANVCVPIGFTNYHWNTSATTRCITATQAGNYYVTVTDNNGCTAQSNHLAINVYPLPPVSITVNGDTLTVYNAITQQWYLNGSVINGATDSVYIAHTGGSYTVQVTDTNGCVATSLPVIVSGVENITEENVVSVFPNPTNNNWQLTVGRNFIGSTAEVFDASGRVVFQQLITNLPAGQAGHQSLITFDAPRGVYLLRISSSTSSAVRKLVRL